MIRSVAVLAALMCAGLLWPGSPCLADTLQEPVIEQSPTRYQVVAGSARVNRKLKGEVTNWIQGVPAEPVDSMCYDGDGHLAIEGRALMEVDPIHQTGLIRAQWTDRHGNWELTQTRFYHPEHLSGLRLGTSRDELTELVNLAIVQNVYVHGDTTAGTAGQPTVFVYLGTWGLAEVTLNGEPFLNPLGWPGPKHWLVHGHVTEGVRDENDGSIRTISGEVYDPKKHKDQGVTDPADLELHLAFHDERFPSTKNTPAMFAFEYHLIFEDVSMRINDSQQPLHFEGFGTAHRGPEASARLSDD